MFDKAARIYPNDRAAILDLYNLLNKCDFSAPDEMRQALPSLDNFKNVDKWYVIDIGGNNLRLIAYINFVTKKLNSKYIATHAEYDKLTEKAKKGELFR